MSRHLYSERDYTFGRSMVTLRRAVGMTQADLGTYLEVSRRAVGAWEKGISYPKAEHLQAFIALGLEHQAFPPGQEVETVRALWQAAHQKVLLDEVWLAGLLRRMVPISAPTIDVSTRREVNRKGKRNKVPFQPTSFVGREAEIFEVGRMLKHPACRLVTLLGPGGMGKTRLSIAVASIQAEDVTFVPLASVGAVGQIPGAIGSALGLSFAGHLNPTERLLDYLGAQRLLLVLDNFEHVLEGASLVQTILEHAVGVKILVTSRERLNLQAEWLFDVQGLSYPLTDLSEPVTSRAALGWDNSSAIKLFVQRALQVQPRFSTTDADLASVVRICRHVLGMPLAIELAAAVVRTLPLPEIEQRIALTINSLSTTLRDVPERHRSMRAVFDHSWQLLEPAEQVLLSRLAVFRGGFTAAAAEQVTEGTLPGLAALVDKSLLQQSRAPSFIEGTFNRPTMSPETRYSLLEPVREYVLEKLQAHGEESNVQYAHAAYYLALAEAAETKWDTAEADVALERLHLEQDNMREALRWARDGGDLTLGLQLAASLWRFWRSGGYFDEGRAWLEELLQLSRDTSKSTSDAARLRAMHAAAWLASDRLDYKRAAQLFEEGMALRRSAPEVEADTDLLLNAALQARSLGQYQQATSLFEEALLRHRELRRHGRGTSLYELGFSLYMLALVLREQGYFGRASELFEESLRFHTEIGEREGAAQALLGLSDVARDQGDAVTARRYAQQCLEIFQEFGTQWAIGFALNNLAMVAYLERDLLLASSLIAKSVKIFQSQKADSSLGEVLVTQGYILLAQNSVLEAYEAMVQALRLAWTHGPRLLAAGALEGLACVLLIQKRISSAVRLTAVAAELRRYLGTPMRLADQVLFEPLISGAKSTLSADDFEAIWAASRDATVEQVLLELGDSNAYSVRGLGA